MHLCNKSVGWTSAKRIELIDGLAQDCCNSIANALELLSLGLSHRYDRSTVIVAWLYGPLARYLKLRVTHAPGMPETFPPPPRVSDSDMHHGTWVTHVPWCMPGLLTCGFGSEENVSGIPGACTTHNFTHLSKGPCANVSGENHKATIFNCKHFHKPVQRWWSLPMKSMNFSSARPSIFSLVTLVHSLVSYHHRTQWIANILAKMYIAEMCQFVWSDA